MHSLAGNIFLLIYFLEGGEEGDFEVCQFLCDVLLNPDLYCEFFIDNTTYQPTRERNKPTVQRKFLPRKIQILAPHGWLLATYVAPSRSYKATGNC